MHIIIDKAPDNDFFWKLIGDDNSEKLHSAFYTKLKDCESHALGLQVVLELGGVPVTLHRNFDPSGQLFTASDQFRTSIEKLLAPKPNPR